MTAPLAVPDTAEGLQEALLDKRKMQAYLDAGDGSFAKFIETYANKAMKRDTELDPELSSQIKDQIDRQWANFVRENGIKEFRKGGQPIAPVDAKVQRATATIPAWTKDAAGASLNGKFDGLMDFFEIINEISDPRDERIATGRKAIKNAMSSTDPASGGFLIPEEFRTELLQVALETAVVRPLARVIPMASLRAAIPVVDVTSNTASVYGGIVAYWTEEGAALTQSQPNFGRIVLEAKKLTAYTEVPNELIADSAITVDALIMRQMFPQAISWFEDLAFLFGTGVGEPVGIFNANNGALISQAAESGQATATIQWENLVGMYSRLLPSSMNSAVWLASPNTFPQLATMALSVGTGGSAVWLNNGSQGAPMTILGRPLIFTEKVTALGGAGDISLVDFNQYLIGDRMAMDAQASPHIAFNRDSMGYRFIERVDGRPWLQSAITPRNSGPTLSPYVTLAARP